MAVAGRVQLVSAEDLAKLRDLTTKPQNFGGGANALPLGGKAAAPAGEVSQPTKIDGVEGITLAPCKDKLTRTKVHEAVRKYFAGFESDTASSQDASAQSAVRIRRSKRRGRGGNKRGPEGGGSGVDGGGKRQRFDPRGQQKTGWPPGKGKFLVRAFV